MASAWTGAWPTATPTRPRTGAEPRVGVEPAPEESILIWCRCKLGPLRAYWVVFSWSIHAAYKETILAEGYEPTLPAAEEAALEEVGRIRGRFRDVETDSAATAARLYKNRVTERRKQSGRNCDDSQV